MSNLHASIIQTISKRFPAIVPHLSGRARWMVRTIIPLPGLVVSENEKHLVEFDYSGYKTYDYYLQNLERLIRSLYNRDIGRDFLDVFANLISGQLTQAFEQAWKDEEGKGELPDYLSSALEDMILGQYDHADGLYNDIVNARTTEEPLEPLLARAALWANRWTEAYEMARHYITMENGGNEEWIIDSAKENCVICSSLNGIVARASEWDELNVHPRNAPNPILDKERGGCGGWECGCERRPTDKRRSPKAYETIINIVSK